MDIEDLRVGWHLEQCDDVRMRRKAAERLNLSEIVHLARIESADEIHSLRCMQAGQWPHVCLLDAFKCVFHALDGHILARLDALCLEHL